MLAWNLPITLSAIWTRLSVHHSNAILGFFLIGNGTGFFILAIFLTALPKT
jgi:hypothetical protein